MNTQPKLSITPLGAGQDVGRSCILVTFNTGRTVMLDCGMHMGYHDERMYPNFHYFTKSMNLNTVIDAVLISHFHLDHCGGLPYMVKKYAFNGPIIMSSPTKAICPILLEDFSKISSNTKFPALHYNQEDIMTCLAKVTTINVHQTLNIFPDLSVKAYYAGHVLGAVMFQVTSGSQSVLYTGDYNMAPDRHLGSAWIPKGLKIDALITESTYATTIRENRRTRERDFLKKVHDTLRNGGNVLLPVFAVGRAQELAILLEAYAIRMDWKWPIYFVGGLTRKSMVYYQLFVHWTNHNLRQASTEDANNPFIFKRITTLIHPKDDIWSYLEQPGGMVVFASPGMLHSGLSLEIFKKWCSSPLNVVILPGYCVPGTVGAQLLSKSVNQQGYQTIQLPANTSNKNKQDRPEQPQELEVKSYMRVENLAFSAHVDGKGIMQLLRIAQPKSVVLVHGEANQMVQLTHLIHSTLCIPCYMPKNHNSIHIQTPWIMDSNRVKVSHKVKSHLDLLMHLNVHSTVLRTCSDTNADTPTQFLDTNTIVNSKEMVGKWDVSDHKNGFRSRFNDARLIGNEHQLGALNAFKFNNMPIPVCIVSKSSSNAHHKRLAQVHSHNHEIHVQFPHEVIWPLDQNVQFNRLCASKRIPHLSQAKVKDVLDYIQREIQAKCQNVYIYESYESIIRLMLTSPNFSINCSYLMLVVNAKLGKVVWYPNTKMMGHHDHDISSKLNFVIEQLSNM